MEIYVINRKVEPSDFLRSRPTFFPKLVSHMFYNCEEQT